MDMEAETEEYGGLLSTFGLVAEGANVDSSSAHVGDDDLRAAIGRILQGADLERLSRRMIRKQLETEFHTNLSEEKDRINQWILQSIEEQQQRDGGNSDASGSESAGSESEVEAEQAPKRKAAAARAKAPARTTKKKPVVPRKKAAVKRKRTEASSNGDGEDAPKRANAFNIPLSVSPELARIVGADTMSRPQIVKMLWEYIREHGLQDPNNKRVILFDDALKGVFQRDTVTMFSMNKYVKRHVRKLEDLPPNGWDDIPRDGVSSDEDEEEKAAKKKATAAKRKKKTPSDATAGSKENRKNNPFNAELSLSPELAAVVGSDTLSRPQIVKAIWEYIRAHDLQDPSDKRTIILDETLRQVFGRPTVTMFSINKYIKRHAMKPDNLPPGGWADVARDGASSDEDEAAPKSPAKKKKAKH